jgi:NitT/TauT family transport system substrate-binding protein
MFLTMIGYDKRRLITGALLLLLVLSACGGSGTETSLTTESTESTDAPTTSGGSTSVPATTTQPAAAPTVEIVSGSFTSIEVAMSEGLYEGVDIEFTRVGFTEQPSLFIGTDTELGNLNPWTIAQFVSQGENVRFVTTAGATNAVNGLVIRTEDAERFQDLSDLVGTTIGNPGTGTATWAIFDVIARTAFDIDPETDFNNLTADPGALLGLLGTGEIDGALLFSGGTAAALARPDEFTLLLPLSEAWVAETGQPLVVTGIVAKADWLDANPDVARAVIEGTDRGVQWIKDNPDEFKAGGKYEELATAEGWLATPEVNDQILELVQAGQWFLDSSVYTQDWIDASYQFIERGVGVLVDEVPPKDQVFYPPLG